MQDKIQAVIMAAGKSTRTFPLTVTKPKPLLNILDKTIIEHTLEQLHKTNKIKEVLIVVNYLKEQIIQKIGNNYKNISIKYITQETPNGTGGAILACKKHLEKKFLVLNGDDLFSHKDISRILDYDYCILAKKVKDPTHWGILETKDDYITNVIEKPKEFISDLANVGIYIFQDKIFEHKLKESPRGEYEITDYLNYLISEDIKIKYKILNDYWLPIGFPWQLLEANVFMLKRLAEKNSDKPIIKGKIEDNVSIKGFIYLAENTRIKEYSYLRGPIYISKDTIIGPFANIRPDTIIGKNCELGRVEIYDALLMDNIKSKHTSYLGHSILSDNINIGAGTITADYRHDAQNHHTYINNKKINTGRRKLGSVLGENVKTGIGTLIYPGRKIWPNLTTLPGEVVDKDKTL
jgi:UDP-N-acetylglucosamine diphosphorylase / glucose-1-phosphate thymidylyltransferase / UDP-N-acetylgalactosamine diphosphorylase / glucosamine-1-phosphate N-acetyltransferase / galactosamine-1-phosphate N-acetyltransferase